MKKKRVVSALLAIIMMFAMIPSPLVYAESMTESAVQTERTQADDTKPEKTLQPEQSGNFDVQASDAATDILDSTAASTNELNAASEKSGSNLANLMIHYYVENTMTPIEATYCALLQIGTEYEVPSPDISQYALVDDTQRVISGVLREDTEISVFYRYAAETAPYKVVYIGKDLDGANEIVLETIEDVGPVGETITVSDKQFNGYVREPADMSMEITADGNAQKVLYYVRQPDISIIFNTGGSYVPAIIAQPGTDITEQIESLPTPARQGYVFDGWDQPLPTTMPEETRTVHAKWKPGQSSYTVEYYFENANNDGYTWNKSLNETRTAQTNSIATVTQADIDLADETLCDTEEAYKEHEGSPFWGFDYSHCEDVTVDANGSSVLKLYFNREIWTIRLMDNVVGTHRYQRSYNTTRGEFDAMNKVVWKEFSGKYGSDLPADFPDPDALREHAMTLRKNAAEKYQRDDLIYAGHIQVSDDTFDDGGQGELRYTKWCTFNSFSYEDNSAPKSHVLHAYPAISEASYLFYLTWMGESLNAAVNKNVEDTTPDDYAQVYYRVAGPLSSQTAGFTAPAIPGFTYQNALVHSNYKSTWKCNAPMWMPPVGGVAGDWHGPGCTCEGRYMRIDERDSWNPIFQACEIDDEYLNAATGGLKRINVAQNTTFYLQRKAYTVYFHSGSEVVHTVDKVCYEQPLNAVPAADGGQVNLLAYQPEVTPEKMTFGGWYLSSDDFKTGNQAQADLTMPAGDLHLYAHWVPQNCEVTFNSNGGTEVPSQQVPLNGKAVFPQVPEKSGYEFLGWVDADGHQWSFDQEITEDTVLDAWWKPIAGQEYRVLHIMKDTNEVIAEQTGYGLIGDTYVVSALSAKDDAYQTNSYLVPDAPTKSITLSVNQSGTVTFYYEVAGLRDYTVSYYLNGTTTEIYPDKVVKNSALSMVTEQAQTVSGYTPLALYQTVSLTPSGENHIIFYYCRGTSDKPDPSDKTLPAVVTLKAQKLLDGRPPEGTQFEFELKDASGTAIQRKASVDGEIVFDNLTFNKTGRYTYTISEVDVSQDNVIGDKSIYTVVLDVYESAGKEAYQVNVTIRKDGLDYDGVMLFLNKSEDNGAVPAPDKPDNSSEDNEPVPAPDPDKPDNSSEDKEPVPAPDKPDNPFEDKEPVPTPEKPDNSPTHVPQTGDDSHLMLWSLLSLLSLGGVVGTGTFLIGNKRKEHSR